MEWLEKRVSAETIERGLPQDVLWLLITIYAYRTRSRFDSLPRMSREQFAVEAILLESAARDIVARLTALDDETGNNRSFQTWFRAAKREGFDAKRTRQMDTKVKAYRASVNELKVAHRNRYIAHVNTDAAVKPRILDDPIPFEKAASMAVDLLDEIIGRQLPYFFKPGSGLKIDLRHALSAS